MKSKQTYLKSKIITISMWKKIGMFPLISYGNYLPILDLFLTIFRNHIGLKTIDYI